MKIKYESHSLRTKIAITVRPVNVTRDYIKIQFIRPKTIKRQIYVEFFFFCC